MSRGKQRLTRCCGRFVPGLWRYLLLVCGPAWLMGCATFAGKETSWWLPNAGTEEIRGADNEASPLRSAQSPYTPGSSPANGSDARKHVYIFLVNGFDPFHYADVPGLAEYIRSLGYEHVYYSELITAGSLLEQIEQVPRWDDRARIVLIGYSFGANAARNLAHSLAEEGITVDLLVYLNGNTLRNTTWDRPANARRVINILAWGVLLDGAQLDNAENIEIPDAWHFNTPTHPLTLNLLQHELAALAR